MSKAEQKHFPIFQTCTITYIELNVLQLQQRFQALEPLCAWKQGIYTYNLTSS